MEKPVDVLTAERVKNTVSTKVKDMKEKAAKKAALKGKVKGQNK